MNAQSVNDAETKLRLELLGAPKLMGFGKTVALDRKLAGVLSFVALEGATPRAVLAELLWANATPRHARQSLRQALQRLSPLNAALHSGDPLRFSVALTVDALEERAALAIGSSGATHDLLEGLEFDDCPEFSEWLRAQRERLHEARLALLALESERLERDGMQLEALRVALRRLAMDASSEPASRQVMRLHAGLGDRAAALRCYQQLTETLERELGVLPLEATQALAAEIARGARIPAVPTDELALTVRLTRATTLLSDGNRLEARRLAESVLESAPSEPQAQRAHLIVASAMLLEGALGDAVPHLEAAAVSRDPELRLRALMNLGNVSSWLHGPQQGLPLFTQALRIAEHSGQDAMAAALHNNLAASHTRLGALETARRHLERALERSAKLPDARSRIQMKANLAQLCLMRAQLRDALHFSAEALEEARAAAHLPQLASAALIRGLSLWRVGDASAAEHLKHARAIHVELGDPLKRAVLEFNLAVLNLEQNSYAFPEARAALQGLGVTNDAALIAVCSLELALLCGDAAERLELADQGLRLSDTPQTRLLHAIVRAEESGIEAALQSTLHETGLGYAALHVLLERRVFESRASESRASESRAPGQIAAAPAQDALESWRAQFETETGGLTPAHREGRLAYYARRAPAFAAAHGRLPATELTLT